MNSVAPTNLIVVSKKWNSPEITIGISPDGITMHMLLSDFLASLSLQLGTQYGIITTAAMNKKLEAAAREIQLNMQEATAPAMAHHLTQS